ncbi:MAG: hypothetical protein M3Y56_15800 [Armatimonadota bacterium]|nr:hypothetical protein [Armatimonadota bacterium]
MTLRRNLVGLGIAAGMALTTSLAFAQAPGYPGGGGAPGGYPGGAGGAPPATVQTTTMATDSTTTPARLPKAGGDPLMLTAAGSMLLTAGYAVRRRFKRD